MKIHFTGIKGIGMSGLAQILKSRGHKITGSDVEDEFPSDLPLKKAGIKVKPFSERNIRGEIDLIIYSTAYDPLEHPELIKAKIMNTKIQSYSEALADLFNGYAFKILVTGSHGKTTTTALIGLAFEKAQCDPTVIAGGQVLEWKSNVRIGKNDFIVAEGDEYQRKFLTLKPNILVITNIDYDHPDFFKTREEYEDAFREMILSVPADGFVIAPISVRRITNDCRKKDNLIEYDSTANLPEIEKIFKEVAALKKSDGFLLSGNIENIYAAKQVLKFFGKDHCLSEAVKKFKGIKRRCEIYHKSLDGTKIVIDDYAHHPAEIKSTLKAIKEKYPNHKILVLFQPHTYSRTRGLMDEFASSFESADAVGILKTYSSQREKRLSEDEYIELKLVDQINKSRKKKNALLLKDFSSAQEMIMDFFGRDARKKKAPRFEIALTMGAGDIWKLAQSAADKIKSAKS
jgi:UDP-N-acetylmuramate--alanine ligase